MPYRLTWEPSGIYREYFGNVTIAERRESLGVIYGDRRFDDLRYAITNYLAVQAYEVDSIATAEIAALHIAPLTTNPRIAIAAVARRPDILAAIDEFKSHGFTSAPYRVFPSLDQARAWLDEALR